jgi:hypothetical protein
MRRLAVSALQLVGLAVAAFVMYPVASPAGDLSGCNICCADGNGCRTGLQCNMDYTCMASDCGTKVYVCTQ